MKSALRMPAARVVLSILLLLLAVPATSVAQDAAADDTTRAHLISAARDIMASAHYCDLITLDSTGRPRSRVMDPFSPEDDMVVWLGTRRSSRKVTQIRNDPRVTLQYFSPEDFGYVTIAGTAELVDDPAEKSARWKDAWNTFYPDREAYLLIKVKPEWLEVLSRGIQSNPDTWEPPRVAF